MKYLNTYPLISVKPSVIHCSVHTGPWRDHACYSSAPGRMWWGRVPTCLCLYFQCFICIWLLWSLQESWIVFNPNFLSAMHDSHGSHKEEMFHSPLSEPLLVFLELPIPKWSTFPLPAVTPAALLCHNPLQGPVLPFHKLFLEMRLNEMRPSVSTWMWAPFTYWTFTRPLRDCQWT